MVNSSLVKVDNLVKHWKHKKLSKKQMYQNIISDKSLVKDLNKRGISSVKKWFYYNY